jgi:hypothetical protein
LGEPLDEEGSLLESPQERKAVLLRHWESRTDTRWGQQIRAVIEIFREVVQYSEHAFTDEEVDHFNLTRNSEAALDLGRPWSELNRQLQPEPSEP